jgi:CDP-6-deoxy-D-xylo-4-hexulose-3-dehydrase
MEFQWPLINDNITDSDKQALIEFLSQPNVRFTQGPKVREFEHQWSKWLDIKHSVMVNSGASANYVMAAILRHTFEGPGEVIVSPVSWISDVAPLVQMGMTPVFVDVSASNFAITADQIKSAITPQTKAIILVHALGFNALSDDILQLADENNLMLIEDCCESHGATFKGKQIGTYGTMSNFSYYFGHHMTSIEGGTVCTNNSELYELAKMFRSHGMIREASPELARHYQDKYPDLNPLFTFAVPGFNVRSTELNAVIGLNQLSRLDSNIDIRRNNFELWVSSLNGKKYWTDYQLEGNSNFALPLVLHNKDKDLFEAICKLLTTAGVEYRKGTVGGGSQARQPYLRSGKYAYRIVGNLNTTNHIHEYGLYVGNHPELTFEQITTLCSSLNEL